MMTKKKMHQVDLRLPMQFHNNRWYRPCQSLVCGWSRAAMAREQEMVLQIMNKCVAFARQGRPLGICGAIAAQAKGKIYIESYTEPAVVEAI